MCYDLNGIMILHFYMHAVCSLAPSPPGKYLPSNQASYRLASLYDECEQRGGSMRLASQSLDYNLCEQSTEQQRGGQSIFQESWAYVEGGMNEGCRAESLSNF